MRKFGTFFTFQGSIKPTIPILLFFISYLTLPKQKDTKFMYKFVHFYFPLLVHSYFIIYTNVEYFKYSSLHEELSLVIELLQKLKAYGINSGDIVLMSAYTIENSRCCLFYGKLPSEVGKIKTDGFMWQAKKDELRFCTISSFKGLEAKIVILLDVDAFSDNQHRLMHYVAISKACAALYVFYDALAEDERQLMLAAGYPKLVQ